MLGLVKSGSPKPSPSVLREDMVWAMGSFCALNRKPFDAELLLKQFPPPYTSDSLVHAARALGFRIKRRDGLRLPEASFPCLVILEDTQSAATPSPTDESRDGQQQEVGGGGAVAENVGSGNLIEPAKPQRLAAARRAEVVVARAAIQRAAGAAAVEGVVAVAAIEVVRAGFAVEFVIAGSADEDSSRIREALANKYKADASLEEAKRKAGADAKQAYAGIVNGLSRIEALKMAVEAAENSLKGNQVGYRMGLRINNDVLDAEQQLYVSRRDLVKARYETIMQGLKLKAAAGVLTEKDIEAIDEILDK